MLVAYIITITLIVLLSFGAVHLHFFFGLHHGTKAKVKVAGPHVERSFDLHDRIFRRYESI